MAENLKPRVNFKSNKTAGFKTQIVPVRADVAERMDPDDAFKPAGPLEGGELRRAALACTGYFVHPLEKSSRIKSVFH